jgi:hypothetical protein
VTEVVVFTNGPWGRLARAVLGLALIAYGSLFGLTGALWGGVHSWVSVLALAVTAVHLGVDRRAPRGGVRVLPGVERAPVVGG